MYDVRTTEQLAQIPRDEYLTADDCDELVPAFNFARAARILMTLGINPGKGGPWLLAIEPGARNAIIYDLTNLKESELNRAMETWTEILYAGDFRRSGFNFYEYIFGLFGERSRAQVIPLPKDFRP
jgi:hypothetical protein